MLGPQKIRQRHVYDLNQEHAADMETLSLAASVDVVISNGAMNLSAHKLCVFRRMFRVLQFADMVRDGADEGTSWSSWADCVSGTVGPQRYLEMLSAAGFKGAELVSLTGYRTAVNTIGATFRARKP